MIELQLGTGEERGFYRASTTFSGTSEPIHLLGHYHNVSVAVHPETGTARVEATLSTVAEVEAGTARWIEWPRGDVASAADDGLLTSATAVRGQSTGNCVIEVLAK